jgi:Ni,Fe-hydrogenase III large subunit
MTDDGRILSLAFKSGDRWMAIFRDSHTPEIVDETVPGRFENFSYFKNLPEASDGTHTFVYGPSSGGMIEAVRFLMRTRGEVIEEVIPYFLFKDRRLRISGMQHDTALMKLERFNGFHSAAYSALFCGTIENICGTDVDIDVKRSRMLMCELERIASHLFVIGRLCEAASQNVAAALIFTLRERVLRLTADHFGHRYFFGVNRIGGLGRNIDLEGLPEAADRIVNEFSKTWNHLSESTIFLDRIQRTCTIRREWMVGPAVRAAGFPVDARWKGRLLPYGDYTFNYRREYDGDALSRALVRAQEIEESASIIGQICMQLKRVNARKNAHFVPESGEGSGKIESPGGEIILWMRTGTEGVEDVHLMSPSVANLPAFAEGIKNSVMTDFSFAWESFGFWIAETGGVL